MTTCLKVICDPVYAEILMAEIAEAGFESFLETDGGFEAYVENDSFDKNLVSEIHAKYSHTKRLIFSFQQIEKKNWNEEWERNLTPIIVEGKCVIRAEFHQLKEKYPYEIIITPKMSFGTGHHQTTYLMIKNQLEIDHAGKRVMDAGCGTAILSIMASLKGAKEVEAFDIDEWSVINGNENCENNHCLNVRIRQGKIGDLSFTGTFDIVLANINKNILLDELKIYSSVLNKGGLLLLSGFYMNDVKDLSEEGERYGLKVLRSDDRETWASLLMEKVK